MMETPAKTKRPIGFYDQLETHFEPELGIMWYYMNPRPRPCMTPRLVSELRKFQRTIETRKGLVLTPDGPAPIRYLVYASASPKVFNLGGDLNLVLRLIDEGNRDGLSSYARACVDVLYANHMGLHLPITTISLIRGECLGGGFESALSSHLVMAERDAQMGFPEILFNLFPGVGAYSLAARRIGSKATEKLILSGRVCGATEMHELGLLDELAEPGTGEEHVRNYVRKHDRKRNALQAIHRARQRYNPVSYEELVDIAEIWVDAALQLTDRDRRIIERLLRAQERRSQPPKPATAVSGG